MNGHGRYLRLSMTERGTAYGYSLFELEAYPPGAPVPAQYTADVEPGVLLASPDAPATGTLTVANDSSKSTTVEWSADVPDGVEVAPDSDQLRVPAGGEAIADVEVTATEAGSFPVEFTVTGASGEVELAAAKMLVSVPHDGLSEAFTNTGVTDDSDVNPPGLGTGFDGAGSSYSAQALAAEGLTPRTTLTVDGVPLTWPDSTPGTPNNVIANGQSVRIDANGSAIGVLAAATYGPATGDWVVHYADGTSDTVRLTTPDWTVTPPAGTTAVADMAYRNNTETGRTDRRSQVFFHRIPVDSAKHVEALTLPTVSPTAARGSAALHVFAVGVD